MLSFKADLKLPGTARSWQLIILLPTDDKAYWLRDLNHIQHVRWLRNNQIHVTLETSKAYQSSVSEDKKKITCSIDRKTLKPSAYDVSPAMYATLTSNTQLVLVTLRDDRNVLFFFWPWPPRVFPPNTRPHTRNPATVKHNTGYQTCATAIPGS